MAEESAAAGPARAGLAASIGRWALGIALFELAVLVADVAGGSFTYFGGADLRTLRLAWNYYLPDIARLLAYAVFFNWLISAALLLPLLPSYLRWKRKAAGLVAALIAAHAVWIGAACIRVPTLFSEAYYQDGHALLSRPMALLCSRGGAVALGVFALAAVLLLARRGRVLVALAYVAIAAGLFALSSRMPGVRLPERSVLVLMADSLRSDAFTPEKMPRLTALADRAAVLPQVLPPLPRTAPAVTSLLTARLPEESGVSTMFSPEDTFRQLPSLASSLRDAGFCTFAAGEYPAEFMRKIDYGFESVDAPLVRFKEIALQMVLSKSPYFLASLSWGPIRNRARRDVRNLFEGLPVFADSRALLRRLAAEVKRCGGRPIFGFVFADQPHFPYVQTWPYYLALDGSYAGRYRYMKDAISAPSTDADKARIRALYASGVRAIDETYAALLAQLEANGSLQGATAVVTGDHGESLYDHLGIMGHGDQIGEMEGIAVPWIVFGKGREAFASAKSPLSTVHLAARLQQAAGIAPSLRASLPEEVLYVQTGEWLANTPNVPRERVPYPELSELLEVKDKDSHIVLKPEYRTAVEYAKQRLWIENGVRWELRPLADRVEVLRDGVPASPEELPADLRHLIRRADHAIAALLVP